MSNQFKLKAEPRTITGKKVKRLRENGITPAVMYGQKEPQNIQLDTLDAFLMLRDAGDNDLIDLELNDKVHKVLARDVQRHVIRGDLIHVDFLEVDLDVALKAETNLIMEGKSVPEAAGEGMTNQLLFSVEIEAKPDALVSEIPFDASRIETTEDILFVRDLEVPDGVVILSDPDLPVAKFDYFQQIEEEEEELEELEMVPGDVEVIGEEVDEEEEQEEAL